MPKPPLVLASASARRTALLREAGYDFEVVPPPIDEPQGIPRRLTPEVQAEAIAWFKAASVAPLRPQAIILAADTIVAVDDEVIGKPCDEQDARRILSRLSGQPHRVITGVVLLSPGAARRLIQHDVTTLRMRPMSAADIDAYIASGEWQGKAGAYAIQESGDRYVEVVDGSWSNVVGLPMELLERMLAELDRA